jgi:phospholipid-translocating ATPase
VKETSEP